jgi:beta-glucosidase-like glycosyl hydrolase/CubicO group peptidase (beta-lactamase class C family)
VIGRATVTGLALLLGIAATSCGPPGPPVEGPAPPPTAAAEPVLLSQPDPDGAAWVEETLRSLTLREAVGQLVFPWISGSYAAHDDPEFLETVRWVEEEGIGGVAISIGTPHAYAGKLNELQSRARIPLLVTSDFENGGPGMRIAHTYALPSLLPQGGGTSFPPTMAFGAVGSEALVERFAEATALEARAVGVHVVFAPVMDVNSNPENPIINTRAFGEDPGEVSRLGRAFIQGARRGGAMTTAKHFPGHGDTRVDSHLTLPEVTADRARLDSLELVPFQAAVDAAVDGVMTAHVSVPGVLGPGAPPATLAPEFMTGILREEMGFDGLLYTDALRMGAITEGYGAGEAAVLAFEAGADVILIPASVPGAVESMVQAVESGRISRARLDASVRRILQAKARAGLHRERAVPLERIPAVVGRAAHRDLAEEAASRSMTLVRDRDRLLPPDPEGLDRVLSITWAAADDLTAGREFDAVLSALLPGAVEGVRVGPQAGPGAWAGLLERSARADLVLLGVYLPPRAGAGSVALPPELADFVDRASREQIPLVLVSFGNPYLLTAVPEVGTYLVAWGDREVSQAAAARAVTGARDIEGRLPISIPPLHQRGEGVLRAADPRMVARADALADARGDALDEAGLLRRDDPGPDPDTLPDLESGPDGTSPSAPSLPPADGVPPPLEWLDMTRSPLETDPAEVGMDPRALEALDAYVLEAIRDSVAPGVALAVGRRGQLVRLRGYGRTDWAPDSPPVTPHTLFDLASLTKVVGTTAAVMALVEEGRLDLDDPVVRHLPDFARGDERKRDVTVRDLLLHRSGLPAYRQFFLTLEGAEAIRNAVWDLGLDAPPGSETTYSDIGFLTLAWVVEAATGRPFDRFLHDRVFGPLGMDDTRFNPPSTLRPRTAPTELDTERRMRHMHGEVHDENAFVSGGVAGHAGLFSTAADLAVLVQALAEGGMATACGHVPASGVPCSRSRSLETRLFDAETVSTFARRAEEGSSRALGWDTPSGRSSAGDFFSARAFGHTGFTGTSIWVDPDLELWVVLLTNRVNPTRDNTRHIPFRRVVHDSVAGAVRDREVRPRGG